MPTSSNPWLLAARPRTLPAAFAPVILGSALAAHAHLFQPVPALLCAAFALLAQIGANFANDYFDFRRGADTANRLGPTRAVAAGLISPKAMLGATFLTLALAAAAGAGLIHYGGWNMVIIGAASLLGALAYTQFAYQGLGEVCALIFFGFVAVLGTYYVESLNWPAPAPVWLAAATCGLLAANILLINNIRDIATDQAAGKRTLAVRFGRQFAQRLYFFNLSFAFVTPIVFFSIHFGGLALIALIEFPLGLLLMRVLVATPDGDGKRFNRLLADSVQFLVLWTALLSVGIVLSPS